MTGASIKTLFKPSLRSASASGINLLPQGCPQGRVPECLDLSIQLPYLHVVIICELLCQLDSLSRLIAAQIHTALNMAI
jgi:hypothetical protein